MIIKMRYEDKFQELEVDAVDAGKWVNISVDDYESQEGHEVECFNVTHQVEACVANTEQILQGETQFLLLSFRGVLRVFHKNNLQAFLLIARGAKNTVSYVPELFRSRDPKDVRTMPVSSHRPQHR